MGMATVDDSLAGAVALDAAGGERGFARVIRAHHHDMRRKEYHR